jgi:hypothetical protein
MVWLTVAFAKRTCADSLGTYGVHEIRKGAESWTTTASAQNHERHVR